MTNTDRNTKLTNRNGRTIFARVTIHGRDYSKGATVCGMPFAELEAQDFRIHQTSVCGSNSDLNCAACIKGSRQIVDAGVPCGLSKRSGAKLHHILERGQVVGTITRLYSDLVIVKRGETSKTFTSFGSAVGSVMYTTGDYATGHWLGAL